MIVRSKEIALVAALVVLGVAAALLEASSEPVERAVSTTAASAYVDRAVYCPPAPQGSAGNVRLVASALARGEVEIGLEPSTDETTTLAEGAVLVPQVESGEPVDVVGFGSLPAASVATSFKSSFKGLSAAACSDTASRQWFFPAGSSANGFDQRVVLYNPFPDDAVVRVTFFTEGGEVNRANLADVPVASGSTTSLSINEFILQRRALGVKIESVRGRVTAWKTVAANTENRPRGVSSSLGATETALIWYFPSGAVGEGNEERISILNPSGKEALVSISIVTDEETLQPPDLMEINIPRATELDVKIGSALGKKVTGPASVVVRSLNDVGIVAERSVFYGASAFEGYASEIGAHEPSTSWWLGAPGTALEADAVIVYNPGQDPAEIDISLSGSGFDPLATPPSVTVGAGKRLRIPLEEFTEGAAAVAHLESSQPIVAERVGYSSILEDVSALMGVPVTGPVTAPTEEP